MNKIFWSGLLLFAIAGCNKAPQNMGEGKDTGPKPFEQDKLASITREVVPVELARVEQRVIRNVYKSTALLAAERDVQILLSAGDLVESVNAREGDPVKKGDVIAKLKSYDLGITYEKQKLAVENAKRLHAQSETLLAKNHIPKETWEQTRLELKNAELVLKETAARIALLTIRAPFDGEVAMNKLEEGGHVSSYTGSAPIRVVSSNRLKGEFSLPVLYHSSLEPGQTVILRTRGKTAEAEVTRITPVVDQSTGTFLVHFALDNGARRFFPGERVNLELPMGEGTERLVLPEKSVVFEGATPYVFVPRRATKEEVKADLERVRFPFMAQGPGSDGPRGKGRPGGGNGKRGGSKGLKSGGGGGGKPPNPDDIEPIALTKEDRERLEQIPRAKKVRVKVEQLPSGEYALVESGDTPIGDGDSVIVIGLSQMANAARIEIVRGSL